MLVRRARAVPSLRGLALGLPAWHGERTGVRAAAPHGAVGRSVAVRSYSSDWGTISAITRKALIFELTQQQIVTSNTLVPWFLENMPRTYFKQVEEETRLGHLKALSAMRGDGADGDGPAVAASTGMTVRNVKANGERTVTHIRPREQNNEALMELLNNDALLSEGELRRVMLFSSLDKAVGLALLEFGAVHDKPGSSEHSDAAVDRLMDYIERLKTGDVDHNADGPHEVAGQDFLQPDRVHDFLRRAPPSMLLSSEPRRFCKHMRLYDQVRGTEDVAVDIEPCTTYTGHTGSTVPASWVSVAFANVVPEVALRQLVRLIQLAPGNADNAMRIVRTHLNVIDGDDANVTSVRLLVTNGAFNQPQWAWLANSIRRVKWLDNAAFELAVLDGGARGLMRGEIICALCALVQQPLGKESFWTFTRTNILAIVSSDSYRKHAVAVADMFADRFDPAGPLSDGELAERSESIMAAITRDVGDPVAFRLLEKLVSAVRHTYRTNLFLDSRYALALRVDPQLLVAPGLTDSRPQPLGVFFVHGRRFNAFHVRFRDVARGGMRLVTPATQESLAIETARHYDENYGLAYAQQLKNKDIPEGGSKAVVLINTTGARDSKHFTMRKCVKAFTDSLLDLLVESPATRQNVVDYLGRREILYLGPDEQVIPDDIAWIIERAGQRGLPTPRAFMSSKAATGINHKDFGVTSEGVVVFLDVALRHGGIDPRKQPFTVKLTGGPDGDVAGNCLKILHREYGPNAKIVGLADGSGCLEDPAGLDMAELLRLVERSEPISAFDTALLGPGGALHRADTDEGARMRNTMHNRVVSDAFIPAGGRPETINVTNWQQFLQPDGTPSSALVVEGANLFITSEARQLLFDAARVQIVKDSSANKCGVICSSYEIIASMLCSSAEFTAIKQELVADVLQQLRSLARKEAELVFAEYRSLPGPLPSFCEKVSHAMNRMSDALSAALEDMPAEEIAPLLPVFHNHLPAVLRDQYLDRVAERVPDNYVRNAIASLLASRIVYNEGTLFVEALPDDASLAATALQYVKGAEEVERLLAALAEDGAAQGPGTGMPSMSAESRERIMDLLRLGGARGTLARRQ